MTDLSKTKEQIMKVASEMFSTKGFKGTSVRSIAQESGVNIAAINYHFGSKENLYMEVFLRSHSWFEEGLKKIAEENCDLEEMVVKAFDFIRSKPEVIRTTIRMMLTDGIEYDEETQKKFCGPPGADQVRKVIARQLKDPVSEDILEMGVRMIFSQLIHYGMICASTKFETIQKVNKGMDLDGMRMLLRHHTQAVVAHLNKLQNEQSETK